ncbi:MAG: hypothetical protein NTZ98_22990, partial [Acidobacteria bacterium]|nr:hypothetical protein [Acidobacteriota bacterium]
YDTSEWLDYAAHEICDKRFTSEEAGIIQRNTGRYAKPPDVVRMSSVIIALKGLSKHGSFREGRKKNEVSAYFEAPGMKLEIRLHADIYKEEKSISVHVNGKKVHEVLPGPSQTAYSFFSENHVYRLLVKAAETIMNYYKPEIKIYGPDIEVVPAEYLDMLMQ